MELEAQPLCKLRSPKTSLRYAYFLRGIQSLDYISRIPDKMPEDKMPEDKMPGDKMPEDKMPENEKPDKMPESEKPDKMPEDKMP